MTNYSKLCPYSNYPMCIYNNGNKLIHRVCMFQGIQIKEVQISLMKNCELRKKIDEEHKKSLEEKVASSIRFLYS